jgi:hypothetical protein
MKRVPVSTGFDLLLGHGWDSSVGRILRDLKETLATIEYHTGHHDGAK